MGQDQLGHRTSLFSLRSQKSSVQKAKSTAQRLEDLSQIPWMAGPDG